MMSDVSISEPVQETAGPVAEENLNVESSVVAKPTRKRAPRAKAKAASDAGDDSVTAKKAPRTRKTAAKKRSTVGEPPAADPALDTAQAAAVQDGPGEGDSAAPAEVSSGDEGAATPSHVTSGSGISFDDLPLGEALRQGIAKTGYTHPTDVQEAVLHEALAGKDLVVQAKTGSGKTSAFGVPLLERIEAMGGAEREPLGLVLAPTRELAHQVAAEMQSLAEVKGTRILPVYGGVSIGRQASALREGVDIVVGTPGRLLDHHRRGNLSFGKLQMIVLDEADEMLSMGFWDDVTDLLKMAPEQRQVMLFSATLPYQIAKAAAAFLKEPARIDVSGDTLTVEGIEHASYVVDDALPKPRQLLYILETEQPTSAVIFCNTRNETEMIAKFLTTSGFVAEALSGNFKQKDRQRVMDRIKSGELRYMVATDVAARGIDINNLSHVFNYSLPEFSEVYLHRVGRTGRIGKIGNAVSMVDGKGLATLTVLEREFGIKFNERRLLPESEISRRRSERIMKELLEKAAVSEIGQHMPTAEEILKNGDEAAKVVAFLLKSYFSQAAQTQTPAAPVHEARNDDGRRNAAAAAAAGEEGGRRRRRRRRRGRGGADRGHANGYETMDAAEALAGSAGRSQQNGANGSIEAIKEIPVPEGMTRIRVNVGFDDGFKGRGAVAKKISALAGINDGIISEVESRREYAVLSASPEIAELVRDRVDGAQIGKKIVSIAFA